MGVDKTWDSPFYTQLCTINTLQTTDEALPGREDGTCSLVPLIFHVSQCSPSPQNELSSLFFCYPEMNALFRCTPTPGRASVMDPPPEYHRR